MNTMAIGLLIIGDEILSGRRTDKHLSNTISLLGQRGLQLSWVRIIGDEPDLIVNTLRETFSSGDLVFSTGGIGGTPDDLTRDAAARALDSPMEPHPEGIKHLEAFARRHHRQLTAEHYRMVTFPADASLVENPVNGIPGFSVAHHYFLPGFPKMAEPMMQWVLDNHYPDLGNAGYTEHSLMVHGQYESAVTPLMEQVLAEHPAVRIFSLPIMNRNEPLIELGVKGDELPARNAMEALKAGLDRMGARWEAAGSQVVPPRA